MAAEQANKHPATRAAWTWLAKADVSPEQYDHIARHLREMDVALWELDATLHQPPASDQPVKHSDHD